YLKPSNTELDERYGNNPAIYGDTVVIGAMDEDSGQNYITNGTLGSADNSASGSGAAWVYKRTGNTWVQQAYLKPSNTGSWDRFAGERIGISEDTIVIGAIEEDGNQTGVINGTSFTANNLSQASGAAYVFHRTGDTWVQQAFLKAAVNKEWAYFGSSTSISGDTIIVGASEENSSGTGVINGVGGPTGSS